MEESLPIGADPGRMKWRYLVAFLGAAAPSFLFVVWWPVGVASWGLCLSYLFRLRSRLAWGTLLCCPLLLWMGFMFVETAHAYQQGRAYLHQSVHAHPWDRRLHPVYRCYRLGECGFTRFHWWSSVSNNLAIQVMYRWMGPMPGTYHGPLPDAGAALREFERTRVTIPVAAWKSGPLVVHGRTVTLGPNGCKGTLRSLDPGDREVALLGIGLLASRDVDGGSLEFVDLATDAVFTLDGPAGDRDH